MAALSPKLPQNNPSWKQGRLCKIEAFLCTSNCKIQITYMFICPPNLTHLFHTICKIIRFKVEKKVFFPCAQKIQQSFGGQTNHFIEYVWIEGLQILILRWVRYMSTKSYIHKTYGTLKKTSFCTKGYAEIHIQRPFFDNKNSIWKILGLKIQTEETYSSASSTRTNLYF
jgi:hypothetical protein